MILLVLPTKGFNGKHLELLRGKNFIIATKNKEIAIGTDGTKVIPDFSFEDLLKIDISSFEELWIIADEGWKELAESLELKEIVYAFYKTNKKIVAVSYAPLILAVFGILKGKLATVYPTEENLKIFKKYNVKYTSLEKVEDGNIITIRG